MHWQPHHATYRLAVTLAKVSRAAIDRADLRPKAQRSEQALLDHLWSRGYRPGGDADAA